MRPEGKQSRPPLLIRANRTRARQRETSGPAVDSGQGPSLRTHSLGQDLKHEKAPWEGGMAEGRDCGRALQKDGLTHSRS